MLKESRLSELKVQINVFRENYFNESREIKTDKGENAIVYSRPLLGGNEKEKYIEILDGDQNVLNNKIFKLEFSGGAYKGIEAQIKDRLTRPRIEDNRNGAIRGFSVMEINGRTNPSPIPNPSPPPCPPGTPPWKCQNDHYTPNSVS